jgi:BASS family bile acid:Na+ symporter
MRRATYRFLDFFGTHATRFLAGGVVIGLAVPPLAALMRPLLLAALVIPLTIALVRIDWSAFGAYARRPGLVVALVVWFLGVSPVLVWLLLEPLPLPAPILVGLVLMTAVSPIVSGAALSLLLGLDAALAVVVIVVTTAIVPFTLPPLGAALLGVALEIDVGTFMLRLALIIGGAFAGAWVVRRLAPPAAIARNARPLDGVSVLLMMTFAIGIMDGVTAFALERPGYVLVATAAAIAANVLLQVAGVVVWRRSGMQPALTTGFLTGNRNMGLVLVALGSEASLELIVFFAAAQIPMYLMPGLLVPLYRRLLAAA